jgi:hypothetical protein
VVLARRERHLRHEVDAARADHQRFRARVVDGVDRRGLTVDQAGLAVEHVKRADERLHVLLKEHAPAVGERSGEVGGVRHLGIVRDAAGEAADTAAVEAGDPHLIAVPEQEVPAVGREHRPARPLSAQLAGQGDPADADRLQRKRRRLRCACPRAQRHQHDRNDSSPF